MTKFIIDFQPVGRRISVDSGVNLLSAAREAGIALTAVCAGIGACLGCKVRLISGQLSELKPVERNIFSQEELAVGWRLSCQAFPQSDIKLEIPPESLSAPQRLQIEGDVKPVILEPSVVVKPFALQPPGETDLRADWERLTESLFDNFEIKTGVNLPVITQFSDIMRKWAWAGRVVLVEDAEVVGFLKNDQRFYGIAVDIGTTKMAAFLVDLETGKTQEKIGAMNPQIVYGEDVVNRIAYANQGLINRQELQIKLVEALNQLIEKLCKQAMIEPTQIVDFVVVGNTAMHHLLTGLAVSQLGEAPYVAAVQQAMRFPAREIGLTGAAGAKVYLPPNIAGFVGADHVAMLLASELNVKPGVALALDIGTNTEISLSKNGQLVCCSCASGPAFEGAHIHAGMRAAPGAIERAWFYNGGWHISTIDGKAPVGICGSGILDVVAEMLVSKQIEATGRFTENTINKVSFDGGGAIVLVPAENSGTGKDILVTRGDIREIQLAKAAIRSGLEVLLRAKQIGYEEIEHFIIAGAFGTYLNLDSAIKIGMFPKLDRDRYHQIGNAAGAGAQLMLISKSSRRDAEKILKRMAYAELTTDPGFVETYIESIGFDYE